jgi:hypothetical protein
MMPVPAVPSAFRVTAALGTQKNLTYQRFIYPVPSVPSEMVINTQEKKEDIILL